MGIVDDAIAELPADQADALHRVIRTARSLAPDAVDGMSYGMPALRVADRPFVAVIAAAKHLSLFPFSPAAIDMVRDDLKGFSLSKGTIRFTADDPIPDEVLDRLLRARLAEITG